jgi:PAS domain-containing protein
VERREFEQRLAEENARLREQQELPRVTLASIGDAVIATDIEGRVTFLNPVAQDLTKWTQGEAQGGPLDTVFKIVNEQTRQPVENPVARVLKEGCAVGLANQTVLISCRRRSGSELKVTMGKRRTNLPVQRDTGSWWSMTTGTPPTASP